jgi:hypothetical protein
MMLSEIIGDWLLAEHGIKNMVKCRNHTSSDAAYDLVSINGTIGIFVYRTYVSVYNNCWSLDQKDRDRAVKLLLEPTDPEFFNKIICHLRSTHKSQRATGIKLSLDE